MPALAGWAVTMVFVIVGWVLFRAVDFASAGNMLAGMFGFGTGWGELQRPELLAVAAAVSMIGPTSMRFVEFHLPPRRLAAAVASLVLIVSILEVGRGQPVSFIYFQF
jgi:hypothetical protein